MTNNVFGIYTFVDVRVLEFFPAVPIDIERAWQKNFFSFKLMEFTVALDL